MKLSLSALNSAFFNALIIVAACIRADNTLNMMYMLSSFACFVDVSGDTLSACPAEESLYVKSSEIKVAHNASEEEVPDAIEPAEDEEKENNTSVAHEVQAGTQLASTEEEVPHANAQEDTDAPEIYLLCLPLLM